jgi:hypothetical protein
MKWVIWLTVCWHMQETNNSKGLYYLDYWSGLKMLCFLECLLWFSFLVVMYEQRQVHWLCAGFYALKEQW